MSISTDFGAMQSLKNMQKTELKKELIEFIKWLSQKQPALQQDAYVWLNFIDEYLNDI